MPRLLMCPPDFYGVEYEINPWMSRERPPDHVRAVQQWGRLRKLLENLGVQVALIPPQRGVPDMVFTANAGLVVERRVFLTTFRHPQRQKEMPYFRAWFAQEGFECVEVPGEHSFEGAGDALFVGSDLFAGYRTRSDIRSHHFLGETLGVRVVSVELVDPRFYHLDTCFCPLGPGSVAYYPPAFDRYGRQAIESHVPDRLVLSEADAVRFAANALVVAGQVVLNTGCRGFVRALRDRGWCVRGTNLSEFIKAGGSARCLTLDLGH